MVDLNGSLVFLQVETFLCHLKLLLMFFFHANIGIVILKVFC